MRSNALTQQLGIEHPIVQGPMAGGGSSPELVIAASHAGALGSLGAAYLDDAQIRAAVQTIRAATDRPFGINLFAPQPVPELPADTSAAVELIASYSRDLGIDAPAVPQPQEDPFSRQIEAVIDLKPALFSFTFGQVSREILARCRAAGILTAGTATTVEEARMLEADGVDAVIAQGMEAGGHRGTFLVPFEDAQVGTLALVPQVASAVSIPVIAAGGIMDGRGIAAALVLGAQAAQMGTAFLACHEAGVPDAYKALLGNAQAEQTRVTRAFSGRPARGIVNSFMADGDALGDQLLPYPLQNALTRPMRTAGGKQGRTDVLSLWAGQGASLARRLPAAELVEHLARETAEALARR